MPVCQTCGVLTDSDKVSCGVCGTTIPSQPSPPPPSYQSNPAGARSGTSSIGVAPAVTTISSNLGAQRAIWLAGWGAIGGVIGGLLGELTNPHRQMTILTSLWWSGIWFAIITACIACGISAGQLAYLKQRVVQPGLIASGAFGFAAGFIGGAIAQGIYIIIGHNWLFQDICWGIAGALVGLALSVRIPNLSKIRGLIGGFLGGVVGCLIFFVVSALAAAAIGRPIGSAAIGFAIGLMIVVSESLFREAWLEIQYGPKESRTVGLGRTPICIGSDVSRCAVFVSGMGPVARRYILRDRAITCEDPSTSRKRTVGPGDAETLGSVTVIVRGG